MSSKKSKKAAASQGSRDDISVSVLYQSRTATLSNADRVCSPEMLFLNGGDLRSLALRPGSYALVSPAEAPDGYGFVFQVWPSGKSLAGNATLNRVWWPNFSAGGGGETRAATVSRLLSAIHVQQCRSIQFIIMNNNTGIAQSGGSGSGSSGNGSHSPVVSGSLRQFSDHVRAHLLDGAVLCVGQRLGLTWKTQPVVVQVLAAAGTGTGTGAAWGHEEQSEDEEYCYRICDNTVFNFSETDAAGASADGTGLSSGSGSEGDGDVVGNPRTAQAQPLSADQLTDRLSVAGFGAYTEQAQTVLRTARLALSPAAGARSSSAASSSGGGGLAEQLFKPPRGVLVHGPPGTGKTLLMRSMMQVLRYEHPSLSQLELPASLLLKAYSGDAERELMQIFEEAQLRSPCVILIDDAETICKRRDDTAGAAAGSSIGSAEAQKRLLSCLLTLIDGSNASASSASGGVLLMAATNRPNDMDAAMRRPGRLDVEVEIGVPSAGERVHILRAMLGAMGLHARDDNDAYAVTGTGTSSGDEQALTSAGVEAIARAAHGYVAADLLLGVKEACILAAADAASVPAASSAAANRSGGSSESSELISAFGALTVSTGSGKTSTAGTSFLLSHAHLKRGMSKVTPSALQEAVAEIPTTHWDDIGGMAGVKQALKEVVEWPMQYPHLFEKLRVSPPQGVLLYGPPGCSKTLMAKALATESGMNFLSVRGPELLSKWLGESEKAVQALFRRARAASPCIVFFDEIDSLAGKRGAGSAGVSDRVLAQLLSELDGITSNRSFGAATASQVILVAATNRPDVLDKALMRPGRIDRKVYVPPPDAASREAILRLEMKKMPVCDTVDMSELVEVTEGFSGAEVVAVTTEAAMLAMDEEAGQVLPSHLRKALGDIKPQITAEMLHFYESMRL